MLRQEDNVGLAVDEVHLVEKWFGFGACVLINGVYEDRDIVCN